MIEKFLLSAYAISSAGSINLNVFNFSRRKFEAINENVCAQFMQNCCLTVFCQRFLSISLLVNCSRLTFAFFDLSFADSETRSVAKVKTILRAVCSVEVDDTNSSPRGPRFEPLPSQKVLLHKRFSSLSHVCLPRQFESNFSDATQFMSRFYQKYN